MHSTPLRVSSNSVYLECTEYIIITSYLPIWVSADINLMDDYAYTYG